MSYRARLSYERAKDDYYERKKHEQAYRDYLKSEKRLPPSQRGRLPPPPPPSKGARVYGAGRATKRAAKRTWGFGRGVAGLFRSKSKGRTRR